MEFNFASVDGQFGQISTVTERALFLQGSLFTDQLMERIFLSGKLQVISTEC
jgi:hypothetical protein